MDAAGRAEPGSRPEVLQRLSGLLEGVSSSLVLSERGDVTPIRRHPNFRIFAAMNPATDVGKKALAPSVRNRFSEFYVDELTDKTDLELIVRSALESSPQNDVAVASRIVEFYLLARAKAETSWWTEATRVRATHCERSVARWTS